MSPGPSRFPVFSIFNTPLFYFLSQLPGFSGLTLLHTLHTEYSNEKGFVFVKVNWPSVSRTVLSALQQLAFFPCLQIHSFIKLIAVWYRKGSPTLYNHFNNLNCHLNTASFSALVWKAISECDGLKSYFQLWLNSWTVCTRYSKCPHFSSISSVFQLSNPA